MNIRVEEANSGHAVGSLSTFSARAPVGDRATIFFVRVLCIVGLAIANYYSWSMTVTGFINTHLLPDNSIVGNSYLPHLVAGFVQLGILAFYLIVPFFQKRYLIVNFVATFFAFGLIAMSAIFALFSITMTSQSRSIVSHRSGLAQGMNKKIQGMDELIVESYRAYLDGQDVLSKRACEGKDRTGVAKCGSIAQGYVVQANAMRDRYDSQLAKSGVYSKLETSDLMESLNTVSGNYLKLSQKVKVFELFSKDASISSSSVSEAFDALGRDIHNFERSLNNKNPDAKGLVLEQVLHDLGDVVRGIAGSVVVFSLAVALLPDILSITFTAILIIARSANQQAVALRRAIRGARQEAEWYDQYASATDTLHKAKQKWRDRRRVASVAEAVDQSVPDTINQGV